MHLQEVLRFYHIYDMIFITYLRLTYLLTYYLLNWTESFLRS